jgi:hypothetical protein
MNGSTLKIQSRIALAASLLAILASVGFGVWAVQSYTVTDTIEESSPGESNVAMSPPANADNDTIVVNLPDKSEPVTVTRHPFKENGGVWMVAIPAVIAMILALILFVARYFASTSAMGLAWGVVALLWIFTILGALTIGRFIFPTAVACTMAASFSQIYLAERKRVVVNEYADYQAEFDREVAERQGM